MWDLYCGAGSIALVLADRVRRVVGFELVEAAVADAHINSELNRVDNCQFLAGDLKERIQDALKSAILPDVVSTDPPRAGMHPQVIQALLGLLPAKIIAVSCNPATLARTAVAGKYEIITVEPFDLFPDADIECVVRLEKKRC